MLLLYIFYFRKYEADKSIMCCQRVSSLYLIFCWIYCTYLLRGILGKIIYIFKTCSIISERKLWVQMVSQIYIRHVSVILTGKLHGIIRYYSSIRGSKNRLCSDHRNSKDKVKEGKTAAQVDVRPETRSWAMVAIII